MAFALLALGGSMSLINVKFQCHHGAEGLPRSYLKNGS
jgi:hypothetical protein